MYGLFREAARFKVELVGDWEPASLASLAGADSPSGLRLVRSVLSFWRSFTEPVRDSTREPVDHPPPDIRCGECWSLYDVLELNYSTDPVFLVCR